MSDIVDRIASKFTSGNDVPVDSARITADEWSALLAHIQRGAVPEGWQVVPEIASDVMQRTFLAQPGTHTEFTHTALQCADFDSRYAAMLAAAPPPDQFRDAAKMMAGPSAFLSGGARYKISNGTVRGLPRELNGRWVALVAADDDCHLAPAPAEVPMPKPVAYGFGNTAITGHTNRLMMVRLDVPLDDQYAGAFWLPLVLADEAHTYGVACRAAGEAAGYARGLAEAGDRIRRGRKILDAALRGEVKP